MKVLVPAQNVTIRSTARYLPKRVVTNADLGAMGCPLMPDEIVKLSGIEQRHWAADDEATSDLAYEACRLASERAGVPIDRLIVGTVSPDHMSPSAACFVQKRLGLGQAPAMDVTASCSGFLYALDVATRAVLTGDRAALACAADVRSRFLDKTDRATSALFGDGAGAAVVTPSDEPGILGIGLAADGEGVHSVFVPAGGSRSPASASTVENREHAIRMSEGPQVYLAAIEGMIASAESLLSALGKSWAEVDLVVPHQPNRRILDRMAKLAKIPSEKMFVNVERIGNVSGATCAIALDEAIESGRIRAGMRVLLVTAGAGYTAGAALFVASDDLLSRRAASS